MLSNLHKYELETGLSIPETRGRKAYNEDYLVTLYIEGRSNKLYKNHSDGARKLAHLTARQSGGSETKFHRLRRMFGDAWNKRDKQ